MTNNLKALKRETKTTSQVNELRAKGLIPGILYGGKSENLKISVEEKLLQKIIHSDTFLSTVIDLNVEGKVENNLVAVESINKIQNL